ncbi:hypothetical protein [Acidisoma sp.]|uniref:hypothetical protein n=1 Tax=Acidisoma sp. TaxID=1872115 RepID=UPI003AFF705E
MAETRQPSPEEVADIGRRHGISEEASYALYHAVKRGGGGFAQFNHPDLGGMGQWSRGGMTQIADMFNDDLKARVTAACEEMSLRVPGEGATGLDSGQAQQHQVFGSDDANSDRAPMTSGWTDWWPEGLGAPASSGAQDNMRYACFPDLHRLAIERDGKLTIYDTGHYRLTGFSQQQSTSQDLVFSGPDGTVRTDSFRVV